MAERILASEVIGCARCWAAAGAVFVSLVLVAGSAHAQPSDEASRSAARTLGYEGVEDYQRGEYAAAADKLERAYKVVRLPSLGLWSARALARSGRLVEAAERYHEVVRLEIKTGQVDVQRQAQADAAKERDALLPRLPHVVVSVEGAQADDVAVTIDGVELPSALIGAKRPVNPGSHAVQGRRGSEVVDAKLAIAEGETKLLTLRFGAASQASVQGTEQGAAADVTGDAHAKPAAESSPGSGQRTFGWIALGVGAAGIGVGTVTGLLALSKRSSIEEFCDDTECLPPAHEDVDSYNSLRTISTIGFIAGFVAAGAGVTLLLTAPSESAPSAGGERRKVPGRVALWLGPGAVGVRGTIE